MKKILTLINIALFIGCLNQIGASQSVDDTKLKKYEIGGQFTFLRRVDASTNFELFRRNGLILPGVTPDKLSELGVGGRFIYIFTKNIAIEAEANFFPDDKRSDPRIGLPIRFLEPEENFKRFFGLKSATVAIRSASFVSFVPALFGLTGMRS